MGAAVRWATWIVSVGGSHGLCGRIPQMRYESRGDRIGEKAGRACFMSGVAAVSNPPSSQD